MITASKDFGFSLGAGVDAYMGQGREGYRKFKKPAAPIPPKPDVLVFPFLDESGQMQLVKCGRTKFDPERDRGKEWAEANCKPILFGMHLPNHNPQSRRNFDINKLWEGAGAALMRNLTAGEYLAKPDFKMKSLGEHKSLAGIRESSRTAGVLLLGASDMQFRKVNFVLVIDVGFDGISEGMESGAVIMLHVVS